MNVLFAVTSYGLLHALFGPAPLHPDGTHVPLQGGHISLNVGPESAASATTLPSTFDPEDEPPLLDAFPLLEPPLDEPPASGDPTVGSSAPYVEHATTSATIAIGRTARDRSIDSDVSSKLDLSA